MKIFYKMVIFFAMFQMAALVIAGASVFPPGTTLYSDFDLETLEENANNHMDIIGYIFLPNNTKIGTFDVGGFSFGGSTLDNFTLMGLITLIIIAGSAISIATHSYVPAVLAILGISFVPMISNSLTFFNKLFTQWDTSVMVYMGVMIGLGVMMLFVVMITETPTHGRS